VSLNASLLSHNKPFSANDRAISAGKKTVQPKDVFEALMELEFEGFAGPCEAELTRKRLIPLILLLGSCVEKSAITSRKSAITSTTLTTSNRLQQDPE